MLKLSEKLFLTKLTKNMSTITSRHFTIISFPHSILKRWVCLFHAHAAWTLPGLFPARNQFWCCVGSGLENHGKYNEFIYAHSEDELYVNLFIPSIVTGREKNLKLFRNNDFPNEEKTSLNLHNGTASKFKLIA